MSLPKLETPTYELKLPSTGESVLYRPFLVREHKILLTVQDTEDARELSRIIKELVDVCTFKKLNIENLAHFDVEYVFMKIRSKSIGEKVDVVVTCGCGNKYDASFNIEDLKVEKPENHKNKIMVTESVGIELGYPDIEVALKIFSAKNNAEVVDLVIENVKGIFDKDNYWEAKDQSKEELTEFVNSLTKEQFDEIENFFVTAPKIVQIIESDCNKCGTHNTSRLEGLQNFFV